MGSEKSSCGSAASTAARKEADRALPTRDGHVDDFRASKFGTMIARKPYRRHSGLIEAACAASSKSAAKQSRIEALSALARLLGSEKRWRARLRARSGFCRQRDRFFSSKDEAEGGGGIFYQKLRGISHRTSWPAGQPRLPKRLSKRANRVCFIASGAPGIPPTRTQRWAKPIQGVDGVGGNAGYFNRNVESRLSASAGA